MCGIVGTVGIKDSSVINQMNEAQLHRGPDEGGIYSYPDSSLFLAMRRLSIVDLSSGQQPMVSQCKKYAIVYNGEIFNAPELRSTLAALGEKFISDHSDTEVVLRGYMRWGQSVVQKLNGMFAFVVHDIGKNCLFGARDSSGIKPLYLYKNGNVFAFSSEIEALRMIPGRSFKLNRSAFSCYLSLQYTPSPGVIYDDLQKLKPGESFLYSLCTRSLRFFGDPVRLFPTSSQTRLSLSYSDAIDQLDHYLVESVKRWTMSDVPIGTSLSGGIDSALILAIASRQISGPIHTWTLGINAKNNFGDERSLASIMAKKVGSIHHEVAIDLANVSCDIEEMVASLGEPYAGGLPSWYIYKEASKTLKVVLTGSGGDELFGNYNKWLSFSTGSIPWAKRLLKNTVREGLHQSFKFPQGILYHKYISDIAQRKFLQKDFLKNASSTSEHIQGLWNQVDAGNICETLSSLDFNLQLPDEFLCMTDRFSMKWSVEARTPFLDNEFRSLVSHLPVAFRFQKSPYKKLLRDVASRYLPPEYFEVPKTGFTFPLSQLMREYLRDKINYLFSPSYLASQSIFKPIHVANFAKRYTDGRHNKTNQMWTLLMFQLWWERQRQFGCVSL